MKVIKKILLGILIIVLLYAGFIALANTLFSTKLELLCSGEYVDSINGKVNSREKDTRAVQIVIATLPFQKQHVMAKSGSILLLSGDADRNTDTNTTMSMANDVDIIIGNRSRLGDSSVFNAISLNRITKAVKIETNSKDLTSGSYREEIFNGVCEPTKPL
jgi:hypothetical protein